jgi:hypothetical protein
MTICAFLGLATMLEGNSGHKEARPCPYSMN